MENVWAFYTGSFRPNAGLGWNICFPIKSLENLCEQMKKRDLQYSVDKIGIVAHGDMNGVIQLDRQLKPETIASFRKELDELTTYLKIGGMLIFFSCMAGRGNEGDKLLCGLSLRLEGRYVIGFTVTGGIGTDKPGEIFATEYTQDGVSFKGLPLLTEQSYDSKWAMEGQIVRIPLIEQVKRPNYRCAWKECPGHESPIHRCFALP